MQFIYLITTLSGFFALLGVIQSNNLSIGNLLGGFQTHFQYMPLLAYNQYHTQFHIYVNIPNLGIILPIIAPWSWIIPP